MSDWPKLTVNRFGEDDVTPATYKTSLAYAGSTNTKGAYTVIVNSTPFDVAGILMSCQFDVDTARTMIDIAVGPSGGGSEVVVFPNLLLRSGGFTIHTMAMRFIPLRIQAGRAISMRFQTDAAPSATTPAVKVQLIAASALGLQVPEKWEDWGTTLASTSGTVLTGGAANTKGAFAQLIAATARTTRWVMFELVSGTIDDMAVDFAIGTQVKLSDIYTTNEFIGMFALIPWAIPAGSQVQGRVACAGGANTIEVIAYGGG